MNEEEEKLFEDLVVRELDACGYFMHMRKDKRPSMDEMIMDFACLYCMERYNKDYTYRLNERDSKMHDGDDLE